MRHPGPMIEADREMFQHFATHPQPISHHTGVLTDPPHGDPYNCRTCESFVESWRQRWSAYNDRRTRAELAVNQAIKSDGRGPTIEEMERVAVEWSAI